MAKYKLIISALAKEDLVNNKFKELRKVLKDKCKDIIKMPWMYPRLYYEKK